MPNGHGVGTTGRTLRCDACGGTMDDAGQTGYICRTRGCKNAWPEPKRSFVGTRGGEEIGESLRRTDEKEPEGGYAVPPRKDSTHLIPAIVVDLRDAPMPDVPLTLEKHGYRLLEFATKRLDEFQTSHAAEPAAFLVTEAQAQALDEHAGQFVGQQVYFATHFRPDRLKAVSGDRRQIQSLFGYPLWVARA